VVSTPRVISETSVYKFSIVSFYLFSRVGVVVDPFAKTEETREALFGKMFYDSFL